MDSLLYSSGRPYCLFQAKLVTFQYSFDKHINQDQRPWEQKENGIVGYASKHFCFHFSARQVVLQDDTDQNSLLMHFC